MKKSGLADSPFFQAPPQADEVSPTPLDVSPANDLGQNQAEKPVASPVAEIRKPIGVTAASESKLVNKQANKLANKQVSKQANKQTSLQPSMQANMQSLLNEKATKPATFRFPLDLLEKLEDTVHVVRKDYRKKLTRKEMAVAALLFLLTDFETYGRESILYLLLIKEPERG